MRKLLHLIPVLGFAATACDASPVDRGEAPLQVEQAAQKFEPRALTLRASDGVVVHANFYAAAKPRALILLFHQAGSNKAEYATIAPRLATSGYNALAIDQRSGGPMFGAINQTATGLGSDPGYADAIHDLRAALSWAANQEMPVILWGSSYSSSLVLELASEQPGTVAAVLAFSPDEYFGHGQPVRRWASGVKAPLFITSAKDDEEIAAGKALLAASPSRSKQQFVPVRGGVHGSSTLVAVRNAEGAEENWRAVLAFLGQVSP